jgi:SAM-dependent methyltransferase
MMTTKERFPELYSGQTPAWDIGRPQPDLLAAFDELPLTGSVLDLGCGTGENTLELARRGLEAWGLDATPAALAVAEKKRAARGLAATFVLGDALDLVPLVRTFDTVLDCGLYHVLEDAERRAYRREIDRVLRPGGRFLMLGLATNPGGPGPRGYSVEELRAAFGKGYREVFVRSASFWATPDRGRKQAWLSLFVREGLGRQ